MQNLRSRIQLRLAIDFVFKEVPEAVVVGQGGPGHARRGHHTGPQLTDDLLPEFGILADQRQVEVFERKIGGSILLVVTVDAVLFQNRRMGSDIHCGKGRPLFRGGFPAAVKHGQNRYTDAQYRIPHLAPRSHSRLQSVLSVEQTGFASDFWAISLATGCSIRFLLSITKGNDRSKLHSLAEPSNAACSRRPQWV